jgi:hypothetical protein
MIDICDMKPGESALDPSLGEGVFYYNFPSHVRKFWCEIDKDRDFYDFPYKVDCVCGNPPYSQWTPWLEKTVQICDRFCYIMGVLNLTPRRLDFMESKGFVLSSLTLLTIVPWTGNSWLTYFTRKINIPPIIDWVRERIFYNAEEEAYFDGMNITIKKRPAKMINLSKQVHDEE